MRSPLPSPLTCPIFSSRPERVASTVTWLSLSLPNDDVVAARSTPLCSESENWLSSSPGTCPLAR